MSELVTEEAEFMVEDFKKRVADNGGKPTVMEMRDTFGKLCSFAENKGCSIYVLSSISPHPQPSEARCKIRNLT